MSCSTCKGSGIVAGAGEYTTEPCPACESRQLQERRQESAQKAWQEAADNSCTVCGEKGGTTAPFACYDCCVVCKICSLEPAHPFTRICDGCKRHINEQYPNQRNDRGGLVLCFCHSCLKWNHFPPSHNGECKHCGWSEAEAMDHMPEQQAEFEKAQVDRCLICDERIFWSKDRWRHSRSEDNDHDARARHA